METKCNKPYCISRRAGKSGPCRSVRNQAGIEKYAAGTNAVPEHTSGPGKTQSWPIGLTIT